jgi:hypothetical protein
MMTGTKYKSWRRKRSPPRVSPPKRLFGRLSSSVLAIAVLTMGLFIALAPLVWAFPNADKVDGRHADAFLAANATATNSDQLDGKDSTDFASVVHEHSGAAITSGRVGAPFVDDAITRDGEVTQLVKNSFATRSNLNAEAQDRAAADRSLRDVLNREVASSRTRDADLRRELADAETVDGKHAYELTYVTEQSMGGSGQNGAFVVTHEVRTFGQPLSIAAPAEGFVRLSGSVTARRASGSREDVFGGRIRHVQSGSRGANSNTAVITLEPPGPGVPAVYGNVALDDVFPVSAGTNTFEVRVYRDNDADGRIECYRGHLTAEYTPYGSALPTP